MALPPPPTTKGVRQSQEVLDAAQRCLGRDGYAGVTLGRVAEEAGVSKRMVLYYFDSREELIIQLTNSIGEELIGQLEQSLVGLDDPTKIAQVGFGGLWETVTSDRALLIALFGVRIRSITDPGLVESMSAIKEGLRNVVRKQLVGAHARGRRVLVDDEVAVTLTIAGFFGLAMEWLDTGDTPELQQAVTSYQKMIAALVQSTN